MSCACHGHGSEDCRCCSAFGKVEYHSIGIQRRNQGVYGWSGQDRNGSEVPFRQYGDMLYLSGDYAEVVFTTEVDPAQYDILLPVVLKYATALYDGSDAVTLNSILKEAM